MPHNSEDPAEQDDDVFDPDDDLPKEDDDTDDDAEEDMNDLWDECILPDDNTEERNG